MKLADYLYEQSLTPRELRRILGVQCRSTVWRYLTGERVPQPKILAKIVEITNGRVTRDDFHDPAPPTCARVVYDSNNRARLILPWSSSRGRSTRSTPKDDGSGLSWPVQHALRILAGRAMQTKRGQFLLDGRLSDLKRIVRAANAELHKRGLPLIAYPGVHPADDDR